MQCVVNADRAHHGAHQFRMLRQRCAHQQAAVAAAHDGELVGPRVFVIDQVLRARREVVEDVLFFRQIAREVPWLAELAAAADVADDVHTALLQPDDARLRKRRRQAQAVSAVAIEHRRVRAVELHVFSMQNRQRHLRAVLRRRLGTLHDDVAVIDGGFHRERRRGHGAVSTEPAPHRRLDVALRQE